MTLDVIAQTHPKNKEASEDASQKHVEDQTGDVNDVMAQNIDQRIPEAAPELNSDPAETAAKDALSESPPSLTAVIALGDPSVDIHERIVGRYKEDKFFAGILSQPKAYKNFELSNEQIFLHIDNHRVLCIPDIMIGNRCICKVLISHAHSILAHLGPLKTLTYLRENVWWKDMVNDVKVFCESCPTCQTSKPTNNLPYRLLEPLKVPTRPWEMIGIDFVGPLPKSHTLNGVFDMILVAIDHLTAMVHLVPTKQMYRARDIAEVMFNLVYKLHEMPTCIVSDRDSLFTSIFWKRLHELTGTEL